MTASIINIPARLISSNDSPDLTQQQLSNVVVMLTEQILKMQEEMIEMAERELMMLEILKRHNLR